MAKTTKATNSAQVRRLRDALAREKAKSAALAKERAEAREQQAASAAILKVISKSPSDVQPVFDAIVRRAMRLIGGHSAMVSRVVDGMVHVAALTSTSKAGDAVLRKSFPRPLSQTSPHTVAIHSRVPYVAPDTEKAARLWLRKIAQARGYRSMLVVPMLRDGVAIGTISVTRKKPGPFSKHEIALLQTFADQAVIAIENVRQFNETKEALEHQKASADILRVISGSPTDLAPVMAAIAQSAAGLCEATDAHVWQREGEEMVAVASYGGLGLGRTRLRIAREAVVGRAAVECRLIHIDDFAAIWKSEFPDSKAMAEGGYRSIVAVPLVRGDMAIGAILIRRKEVRPFSEKQLALLQTFADQAVIAIENVRLFNETKEALERQTATAEILKVISRSPTDIQPVLDAVVRSAARLCEATDALIRRVDNGVLRAVAHVGSIPIPEEVTAPALSPTHIAGRAVIERRTIHVHDVTDPEVRREYPDALFQAQRGDGFKTLLIVPLIRNEEAVGIIGVRRAEKRPFSEQQISLLQSFADQAVIAIENVRLFNETKESLEQQTAISEILRVMSDSPSDVVPVLEAVADRSMRICESTDARIFVVDGDQLRYAAGRGDVHTGQIGMTRPITRGLVMGRAVIDRTPVHVEDLATADETEYPAGREVQRLFGHRTTLAVPLLREGKALGAILLRRNEVRSFTEKQISLLKTFADQAAIAIENVRLFNETKEALERQTATAEILRVIGSSPTDTQPVFEAIVQSGLKLFPESTVGVTRPDGDQVHMVAIANRDAAVAEATKARFPIRLTREYLHSTAILDARVVDLPDAESAKSGPFARGIANFLATGNRAMTVMPMLRGDKAIGAISVTRPVPGPLTEKQLSLLRIFADQAVIAIENVRLFNETKESLERQTATAAVLRVISGSPNDLAPVFEAILEHATTLCEGHLGFVFTSDGQSFDPVAQRGLSGEQYAAWSAAFREHPVPGPLSGLGKLLATKVPIHIADIAADEAYRARDPLRVLTVEVLGGRTFLAVPLIKESSILGAVVIYRREVRPFADKQVLLLQTFADQAVIAIENVRLFNETKEALERQTATAEILKVISATPTDVRPVLDAVASSAARLCEARDVAITLKEGDQLRYMAHQGEIPTAAQIGHTKQISNDWTAGRAALEGRPIHIRDVLDESEGLGEGARMGRQAGYRTVFATPLLRHGAVIGVIVMRRGEVRPFEPRQIELVNTFADQAVIAIENVRLFNETKESLERQTATAEILKVIASSPSDVQPVFDAIVNSVARLFGRKAALRTVEAEGLRRRARSYDPTPGEFHGPDVEPLDRKSIVGLAILEGRTVQWADTFVDGAAHYGMAKAKSLAFRSIASAPLMREGKAIGVISVSSPEPGALSEKQMALLSTFADQAVIAIENARLFNETKESLERQTATAEILKVIASSPSDVQPVFDTVARKSVDLCNGSFGVVTRFDGQLIHVAAISATASSIAEDRIRAAFPAPPSNRGAASRCILTREIVHMPDVTADAEYTPDGIAKTGGIRSLLAVPLMRGGAPLGSVSVARTQAAAFTPHQIALLRTFADQAVIAIENVRLFNETKEALERQTATAEILKVIASSPSDVQPVFDAIAASARRLLGGHAALVAQRAGDFLELAAFTSTGEAGDSEMSRLWPAKITGRGHMGKALVSAAPAWVEDIETDPDYSEEFRAGARARGMRSAVSVPMLREGEAIGVISVNRSIPGRFSDHQTNLLKTFADQALIAIENVRLFNETQEALARQEAAAQVLRSISESVSDTAPVFTAILECCNRLIPDIDYVQVQLIESDRVRLVDHRFGQVRGAAPGKQDERRAELMAREAAHFPRPLAGSTLERALNQGRVVILADTLDGPDTPPATLVEARRWGHSYSQITVPLMSEGRCIGAIEGFRRRLGGFEPKESSLLESFADQAVVAIQNARLFNETKEALERQTATAEILKVIASSPGDVQPVFDAIVQSAAHLFGRSARIRLIEGNALYLRAASGPAGAAMPDAPLPITRDNLAGRVVLEKTTMQIVDTQAAGAAAGNVGRGYRAIAVAPLVREGHVLGGLGVTALEPGALSDKQMELLTTFADQAVIAIENVRLFNELQSRTEALGKSVEKLTALGEVGQAISSTLDLEKVLTTIASHAVQLTGLDGASIYEYDEAAEEFRLQVAHNFDPEFLQAVRNAPIRKGDGTVGGVAITLEPAQVTDILEGSYHSSRKELLTRAGYRAVLTVPLLREDHIIGALSVTRKTPGPFADEVVELLKTFATQSAMAIQNARLFREIAEKGKQLEEASKHKSQFLASMSHELRTPLNAILGFNEMILGDIYGEVPGDMKEPLTDIQTSGKHLLRLINNVLDLAKIEAGRMELALDDYSVHDTVESVRSTLRPLAEAKGLELAVSVPPDIPLARGDGGRITQCLMNLAGNSLKFTKQGRVGISVVLSSGMLTYQVRDTGIGIPSDKIGSLFTEFKQTDATIASEYGGTGLGLSITKKFIEMHGGRIWAESEPGSGSTFIFVVPLRAGEGGRHE